MVAEVIPRDLVALLRWITMIRGQAWTTTPFNASGVDRPELHFDIQNGEREKQNCVPKSAFPVSDHKSSRKRYLSAIDGRIRCPGTV